VPLVGVSMMVQYGLYCLRGMWGCAGVLWHWGVTAVMGGDPGQAAHTCWGRRGALGYAQEDLEYATYNILYYRNCGIQHEERGHGHLADDQYAGDGRGGGVRVRPASDVARYQLDLLRHAGDNCRQ
jgi:hypothetical protein